jgi:hypothetical protein
MVESAPAAERLVAILEERGWRGWTRIERVPADRLITEAIKWGDANFAFAQLRRQRTHTSWPPP